MTCWPSHYLNQCWLLTNKFLWHSCERNFAMSILATIMHNEFEKYTFKPLILDVSYQAIIHNDTLRCSWSIACWRCFNYILKVHLHGTRQAVRMARDRLQRDLLRSNSVYMVGSCPARLLHIIHVSAVFGVGVLLRKLRQLFATACSARQF